MKLLLSILVGLAVAFGIFSFVDTAIVYITSGIQDGNLKGVMRVVMWIFFAGATLFFSIMIGYLGGAFIYYLIQDLQRKYKRWTQKKK